MESCRDGRCVKKIRFVTLCPGGRSKRLKRCVMLKLLLVLSGVLWLSPGNDPNLLGKDWGKFHQTNIQDRWGVQIREEISWFRKAGADCGSSGVLQRLEIPARGKLLLRMEVRVDSHSLRGSGWWADRRGGTGEYPAKIRIDYLDDRERNAAWTHGFLTNKNPNRLLNYTQIKKGEWTKVELELDLGEHVYLRAIRFYGIGWSFEGAVRNMELVQK